MRMDSLKEEIKHCKKCKNLVASRRQAVPGDGLTPAKVLFVGLSPGRNGADITGIPFTRDSSGLLFREMLEIIDIKNFYVSNIVKCNPKDSKGRNRTPTNQEIKNCRKFLDLEVSMVTPDVIVPFGAQATEFFLGPIKSMASVVLTCKSFDKYIVVPLYHPSTL